MILSYTQILRLKNSQNICRLDPDKLWLALQLRHRLAHNLDPHMPWEENAGAVMPDMYDKTARQQDVMRWKRMRQSQCI